MKKIIMGCFVAGLIAVPTFVQAQDAASGTLTVTGTVVSSISLTIESAGGTFSQGGTAAALTGLGSISKFGGLPTDVDRTRTTTAWTLSSDVGVTVTKANSISTAYTLNAKLAAAPVTGMVWKVDGFTLNEATVTEITAAGQWETTPTYVWTIEIQDSVNTATSIGNVIEFSAISG